MNNFSKQAPIAVAKALAAPPKVDNILAAIKNTHKHGTKAVAHLVELCGKISVYVHFGILPANLVMWEAFYAGKAALRPRDPSNSEPFMRCCSLAAALKSCKIPIGVNFKVHLIFYPDFCEDELIYAAVDAGGFALNDIGGQSVDPDLLYIISVGDDDCDVFGIPFPLGKKQEKRIFREDTHHMHVSALDREDFQDAEKIVYTLERTMLKDSEFDYELKIRNEEIWELLTKEFVEEYESKRSFRDTIQDCLVLDVYARL